MTPKAFDLLGALLEVRPRALSKAQIRDRLWPQTFVAEATLASVVSELRAGLGDDAKEPRFVRTVHGHGYAFAAPAAEEPASAPRRPTTRRLPTPGVVGAAASALLAVGALLVAGRTDRGELDAGIATRPLAVLPLQDLSNDLDRSYAIDGMTEALAARLAEGGLTVVSRTSALRYRGSTRPRSEIARELGASWLVEGSVRRDASRMRLVVRLVVPPDTRPAWTRSYDAAVDETAALPARVARDVVEASRLVLTPDREARLHAARPVDPEAYDAYLRGRHLMNRGSLESNRKAIEQFQEALGRDPRYAPAYAHLSIAYGSLAAVWGGEAPRPMRTLAAAAAQRALDLDPDLADAHTSLATVKFYEWDFAGATSGFRRAIELDPSAGNAHTAYGTYLAARGRFDEALAEARRGEALDPLSVRARRNVGYVLFQARRYDDAISTLQAVAAAEPNDFFTQWFLGWACSFAGRHGEAVPALERAVALSDRLPSMVGAYAQVLARGGREREAREQLASLEETARQRYVSPAAFVFAQTSLGEREDALRSLERGFEERANLMVFLKNLEALDPLRGDPRFQDLLRRIGL